MAPAKRKATSSPSERPPTKKFLRDRQLIVEGLPQGITKTQLSDSFLPYKIVDDANLEVFAGRNISSYPDLHLGQAQRSQGGP
jgi:hypothetical protein